jgi:hypothetical protein
MVKREIVGYIVNDPIEHLNGLQARLLDAEANDDPGKG